MTARLLTRLAMVKLPSWNLTLFTFTLGRLFYVRRQAAHTLRAAFAHRMPVHKLAREGIAADAM